jgi:putative ATP-binding cassette transporter
MQRLRKTLIEIYRLASPYFRGEEKWIALGLLGVIVGLRLFNVWLDVRFNQWNNDFYNALQKKDWATFTHQMFVVFSWIAGLSIFTTVFQYYFMQWLQIRWRNWMTGRYLKRWMNAGTHYRMRLLGNPADNPDQRISDDTQRFVGGGAGSGVLDIGVALMGQLVTLLSFLFILWSLSGSSPLVLFGPSYYIPGYLVWTALIYAIIGTVLTHLLGRPLVPLNFDQQRFEADFRFGLVRLRENAEEVAFLNGEASERDRLTLRFSRIIGNWYRLMSRQKNLTFLTAGYSQIAIIFPFVVVSPLYFSGAIELGGLMQIASAFGTVQGALSFFVTAYSTLAEWKSVVNRLTGFEAAMGAAEALEAAGPQLAPEPEASRFSVDDLRVKLPNGREIVRALDVRLDPGERVLVTGPSGSGKTSLFRALGGIWPFGSGKIRVPQGARVLVLPQRAYLPLGSLRGTLTYPEPADSIPTAEIIEVLTATGLGHFIERLDEEHQWANQLSGGEQQRIGIARALLEKPDWLFLDEATGALDEESEEKLYGLLKERLPKTTIVSIGHRSSLAAFHDRFFTLKPDAAGAHVLTATLAMEDPAA